MDDEKKGGSGTVTVTWSDTEAIMAGYAQGGGGSGGGGSFTASNGVWQQISTAPRDGTPIEIKNSYGVTPWYDLCSWSNGSWRSVAKPGQGMASESRLTWRPYTSDPNAYVDPTGGMQNDPAYWRGAVARKYGLSPTHFEREAARNQRKKSWWRRLFTTPRNRE